MAEMDVYHEQKIEDVKMVVGDHLDGEIVLYEQVCFLVHVIFSSFSSFSFVISVYKLTN